MTIIFPIIFLIGLVMLGYLLSNDLKKLGRKNKKKKRRGFGNSSGDTTTVLADLAFWNWTSK